MKLKDLYEQYELKKHDNQHKSNTHVDFDENDDCQLINFDDIGIFYFPFSFELANKDDENSNQIIHNFIKNITVNDGIKNTYLLIDLCEYHNDIFHDKDTINIFCNILQVHYNGYTDWYIPTVKEFDMYNLRKLKHGNNHGNILTSSFCINEIGQLSMIDVSMYPQDYINTSLVLIRKK